MSRIPIARLVWAALVLHAAPARAEQLELDLHGALDRARRVAPEAVAARGRIAEAEAGAVGPELAFTVNPELEGGAGPRLVAGRPIDVDVRVQQDVEPWRRTPRRRLARAEGAQARAQADVVVRDLELEVSLAFYEALASDRATELAARSDELARRVAEAAQRRRKAGDITDLDLNLTRIAHGRARADVETTASARATAIGRLAALVGAAPGDTIVLRGDLKPSGVVPPAGAVGAQRADVRALEREREVAVAERERGIAGGRPGLALWGAYQREDTTPIVLGGLRVTLPIWNRGQGEQAVARAKERRAVATREATVLAAARQAADAYAAYQSAERAVAAYERDTVPLLDDSERLLERTVEAGQLAIGDYLVMRQELLEARRAYLERLLALAKTAAQARYAAGVAP